jgi:hypothetical protein
LGSFHFCSFESWRFVEIQEIIYRAMDDEKNPEVEKALAGINDLEKEIALVDYELRTFFNPPSFLPSVREHNS